MCQVKRKCLGSYVVSWLSCSQREAVVVGCLLVVVVAFLALNHLKEDIVVAASKCEYE